MPDSRSAIVNIKVCMDNVRKTIEAMEEEMRPVKTASDAAWKVREAYLNGSNYEFILIEEKAYNWLWLFLNKFFYLKNFKIRKHKSVTREGYLLVEVYL